MKIKFILFSGLAAIILFSLVIALNQDPQESPPQPMWGNNGKLINDTIGNTPQQNPQVAADSQGNNLVVWEDARNGYFNIYCQKISDAGAPMWDRNGIALASIAGNQNFPQIIGTDGNTVIIVWQDYRSGHADIYAQKIDGNGQLLWDSGGVVISGAAAGQFSPQITTDGAGGAIITWHDYRSGGGEDIYAQRINASGKTLWEKDGLAVAIASGTQWYPQIASDGLGGAIIVWTDGREGSGNNNIFGQRLNGNGAPLWQKNGIALCKANGNQDRPVLIKSNYGYILAWNDSRFNNTDIYAQKIDDAGSLLWKEDGVMVCSASFNQDSLKLASDGSGGAIIVWKDERLETNDVYAQKITKDGTIAWQENGRPICKANGNQDKPNIIKVEEDAWEIFWEDNRFGTTDLFAQKINSSGTPLWKSDGISIASFPYGQEYFSLCLNPGGAVFIAWQDSRFGSPDIFAQKITSSGSFLFSSSGLTVCNAIGSVVQQNIEAIENGKGEIILSFEDSRSGFFNIYLQKISKAGNLSWGTYGIPASKVAANQANAQLVGDGNGGALVCWEDYRIQKFPCIRAQHINQYGALVFESSLAAADFMSAQTNPAMVSDGAGGAIIAWHDNRNVLSLQDIYCQRTTANGKLLWGKKGKAIISENGDQTELAMVSDGDGGAYFCWTDYRGGDRNPDIYAQHINSAGEPLWKEDGVLICGAPDIQRSPKLVRDEQGGIIISWTDKGGGSYDIYSQRLSASGQTMWMTDGVPVNQLSRSQQNAKFGNASTLVWEDYRMGNWDIYAGAIESNGRLTWKEEGVAIAQAPQTQYAPDIAPWKNRSVIIAWEDYRSSSQYEIFMQKLNAGGACVWEPNGIKIESKNGARLPKVITDPKNDVFYVFWEDFSNGGRAIYGQKFQL